MSGRFITFEGPDGSGKSTQAAMLAQWLEAEGHAVVRTREPGGTPIGVEIRRLVQHTDTDIAPRAEALLYAADRAHHVETVVRPALERGDVVVQDRYLDSSVAYQGAGRDLAPGEIRELSLWSCGGLLPDLTVLLDIDVSRGAERLAARGQAEFDRLETAGSEFAERVRAGFLELAAAEPERFVTIDADAEAVAVHERVVSAVRAMLEA